jgi:hypothetical protein
MPLNLEVKGIKQTFEKLNAEINEIVNDKAKDLTRQTVRDLVEATPVDTGRARDSWKVEAVDIDETQVPKERVIAIIDNEVPYMSQLNAGSSKQAGSRFIEKIVLQYFDPDGVVVQVKKS